jgi:glutaredoxin-like protein NrdH
VVTVYTKPECQACKLTKKALEKEGIEYQEAPLDDDVLEAAKIDGILSAPIVTIPGPEPGTRNWWGGFRPDRIKALTGFPAG